MTIVGSASHKHSTVSLGQRQAGFGLIFTFFFTLLMALGALILAGKSFIQADVRYVHCQQVAADIADDPNSHSQEDINDCVTAFKDLFSQATQAGAGAGGSNVVGGLGVKQILVAGDAQDKVRNQQFVITIVASPAAPAHFQPVTVTITVLNSTTGTPVTYTLAGSDGYHQGNTLTTDDHGVVSFTVPGGAVGVTDVITVTVGPVTQTFTYTFD